MFTKTGTVADLLTPYGACEDALEWASGYTSRETAWRECPRADWMLWILVRARATDIGEPWSDKRKRLVACCLDCAETAAHLWPKDQAKKIEDAVKIMRGWIDGTASVEQAQRAHDDLWDGAANVPYSADVAVANAAYAAIASAARVAHVVYIVDAAANNAAAIANLADIVRQHYPESPK